MEENPIPLKSDVILAQDRDERPFHIRAWELKVQTTKKAKHIAVDCGLAESTVSRYLSGTSVPPDDVARRILQYLRENLVQSAIPEPAKVPAPQKMQENADETKLAFDTLKAAYEARIADLWKTIDNTEKTYNKAMEAAERHAERTAATAKRDKWGLFALVCVLLGMLIFVLLDASNPNWGTFMPRR